MVWTIHNGGTKKQSSCDVKEIQEPSGDDWKRLAQEIHKKFTVPPLRRHQFEAKWTIILKNILTDEGKCTKSCTFVACPNKVWTTELRSIHKLNSVTEYDNLCPQPFIQYRHSSQRILKNYDNSPFIQTTVAHYNEGEKRVPQTLSQTEFIRQVILKNETQNKIIQITKHENNLKEHKSLSRVAFAEIASNGSKTHADSQRLKPGLESPNDDSRIHIVWNDSQDVQQYMALESDDSSTESHPPSLTSYDAIPLREIQISSTCNETGSQITQINESTEEELVHRRKKKREIIFIVSFAILFVTATVLICIFGVWS